VKRPGFAHGLSVPLATDILGQEDTIAEQLDFVRDPRSNYQAEHEQYTTNIEGVFSTGDSRRGQSVMA
jgi:glutamate synthase (NADPH/NADH) small chain